MSYTNPFSFVLNAFWDILESNADFCSLVKADNRIKLESGHRPFKSTLVETSVPEVSILPAGKQLFDESTCGGAFIVQKLQLTVASGKEAINSIHDTEWQIIKSMYTAINSSTEDLMSLQWEGEEIIKQMTFLPMEEGLTNTDQNRELRGWAAILPLDVKLYLTNSLLLISE